MAIESKRIAKNTGLLYIRMLLLMVVSLYTSRIVLSTLGVTDYGLYNVIGGVVTMIGFLNGTMSTTSARFITVALSHNDLDKMRTTFNSIFIVNFVLAIIVIFFAETVGLWFLIEKMTIPDDRCDAAFWVYQFSIITVALNIITVPFNASIIAHERMSAFAYISLIDAFAKLFVVYLIKWATYDKLILYAFLIMFIHIVDIIIYNIYCLKRFTETRFRLQADWNITKEILQFVLWSSYGSFVSVGFSQGLNIILNMFFGPAVNAARGIAVQVQYAVSQFTHNFQTAINPQIIKKTAQHEFEDARKLLVASSKYSFFILCILGIPIIIEAPFILHYWLEDVPEYSLSFCRIMIVICIWNSLGNPLRVVNQAEGNIKKFQLWECTLLLMIMPISYFTLRFWQIPIMVFVVHLIIELFSHIVRLAIVLPKINMSWKNYVFDILLKIIPVFCFPLLLFYFIFPNEEISIILFIRNIILSETILLFMIFYGGVTRNERTLIFAILKRNIEKPYKKKFKRIFYT